MMPDDQVSAPKASDKPNAACEIVKGWDSNWYYTQRRGRPDGTKVFVSPADTYYEVYDTLAGLQR
jgi:hypothetical protein